MEPIRVPRPPAEAFNKDRPISDLIRAQVAHFKHIEQKFLPAQRRAIPRQGVTTEGEAARYIAAMTLALRGHPAAQKKGSAPKGTPERAKKTDNSAKKGPK